MHLFLFFRKVGMGKKINVIGSLLREIERRKVFRDEKEVIETRFILFKSRFNFKVVILW